MFMRPSEQVIDYLYQTHLEARHNKDGITPSEQILRTTDRVAAALDLPPVSTYE
jgi:hypothetical protein